MGSHTTRRPHLCRRIHGRARASHAECVCTRRRGNSNSVRVILSPTLDTISRRQKGIEALDESWVAVEQGRNALDYTRCIDATGKLQDVPFTTVLDTYA